MIDERMELYVAVCEDDPVMLERLKHACEAILGEHYVPLIVPAGSAKELLSSPVPFQLAVLDVQLPEEDGIHLARELLRRNPGCRILFVSGFLMAVSEVYQVPHFCFILKDQLEQQLPRFLKRAADAVAEEAGEKLTVWTGKRTEQIPLSRIVSFERRGHVTYLRLLDGAELQTNEKLSDLILRIDHGHFVRCHISYIVNLVHVERIEENGFQMKNREWVPISRPNLGACRDAFWASLDSQF